MLRLSRLPKRSGSMPWAYPSISLYIACGQKTYRLFRIFPARKNNNYKKRSPESAPSFPGEYFIFPPAVFFSLFIFRRLIFVSLFLFVTTFVRFRPLSSPFVIVSVRYRFPVFRSSNEVEQFPVRMRAGDAAHFETKIGIRELLSLLPFLYGKDVFSVRVDKFCFPSSSTIQKSATPEAISVSGAPFFPSRTIFQLDGIKP